MRILKSELRLRVKNRKPRLFSRAASADAAFDDADGAILAREDVERDSAISSPSTPNSSLSSHSNLIGGTTSPNTPSPATPTQQPGTPLGCAANTPSTPGSGSTSGHKNSLKGTKLARRARSFKDDLFEKISLMRTPTNTLGRSHSPNSPRSKNAKPPPTAEEVAKSSQSLETHVKDISNALKYFRDVILKKKLELLPGNGTVILETIASMYAVIQSYVPTENSPLLLSATQQVYQSLGKLIKLCDEVMLTIETDECASLSDENVEEILDLLRDAVRNLVTVAQQKLKEKEENAFKYGPGSAEVAATPSLNHLMRPPVEIAGQRTSLPDITLTPKERDILEKTNSNPIRASHSTESILRDTSPPPKPPLPNRSKNPPPLPPKRRSQQHSNNISINSDLDCSSEFSLMNYGVDHLSVRSRSPDENSSQCSLDSALNHSREEEELKALELENRLDDNILDDDVEKLFITKSLTSGKRGGVVNNKSSNTTQNSSDKSMVEGAGTGADVDVDVGVGDVNAVAADGQNVTGATVEGTDGNGAASAVGSGVDGGGETVDDADDVDLGGGSNSSAAEKPELRKNASNRHSNESGFVSMSSVRTSAQSMSKRSSDYGVLSSCKSSNSELGFSALESSSSELQMQQQQHTAVVTSWTAERHKVSSAMVYAGTSLGERQPGDGMANDDNHSISNASSASPDYFERERDRDRTQSSLTQTLTKANSLDTSSSDGLGSHSDLMPPALPPKSSRSRESRLQAFLDHTDAFDDGGSDLAELRPHNFAHQYNHNLHQLQQQQQHHQHHVPQWQTKHQSLIESRHMTSSIAASCNALGSVGMEQPPPLPIKKKHILAYMEICSGPTRSIEQNRHTVHSYNMTRNITHSQTMNIVPLPKDLTSPERETPPALPPKNYKPRKPSATPPTIITTPPPSPKPTHLSAEYGSGEGGRHGRVLSQGSSGELMSTVCEELSDLSEEDQAKLHHSHYLPSEREAGRQSRTGQHEGAPICTSDLSNEEDNAVLEHNSFSISESEKNCELVNALHNMLEEIDIRNYLVLKKESEDGPEVKGGYIDALIVHASRVQKNSDNAFSEAFITTFRTFIQPIDVIEKLTHRYTVFFCQLNDQKQKAAKETFSLLVRVVNDLTAMDLTNQLLTLLVEFIYQLVCSGQLYQAKLLRIKFVEKVTLFKEQKMPIYQSNMHTTVTNLPSLLDLKSIEIAEQMTLLDAELFQKIEIPEVLLFAKEQCEEKSPNLNKFTEHFNKMSYWARSKILTLTDAKDREKHVIKFIKIMKHLRKMNNYNSYLALLSALDSAPIRRLEWHKTITEGLKEYCTLIDSSSSFRAYRQALAETNPPCIPYIGLVLQDLTFVHVGNPDYLREGVINFSKRWQQYNIIVNMKRFKKCSYPFRRNERIIEFFENFENFLGEEEMWQISETIKPRGKRPVHA